MKPVEVRTITDAKALAAMANPLRSRILDVLAVHGPATASAIAGRVELAVGSASHHLKVLAEAGLVQEAPELARDRRERWWRASRTSISWSVADAEGDPVGEVVATAAEQQNLAHHVGKVQQWY